MTEQETQEDMRAHSDLHVRIADLMLRLTEQLTALEARLAECERLLNVPRKPNHDQQLV